MTLEEYLRQSDKDGIVVHSLVSTTLEGDDKPVARLSAKNVDGVVLEFTVSGNTITSTDQKSDDSMTSKGEGSSKVGVEEVATKPVEKSGGFKKK